MTIRRRWAIAGLVLAMAMLAAACSDVKSDQPADTGSGTGSGSDGGSSEAVVPDNSDITIKLAVNGWVGAEANANVAANLLRDKLHYTPATICFASRQVVVRTTTCLHEARSCHSLSAFIFHNFA